MAVAQICQSMGWDSVQKSTHDLLTDVLQKYLEEIGKSAYGYSQLCRFCVLFTSCSRFNCVGNVETLCIFATKLVRNTGPSCHVPSKPWSLEFIHRSFISPAK